MDAWSRARYCPNWKYFLILLQSTFSASHAPVKRARQIKIVLAATIRSSALKSARAAPFSSVAYRPVGARISRSGWLFHYFSQMWLLIQWFDGTYQTSPQAEWGACSGVLWTWKLWLTRNKGLQIVLEGIEGGAPQQPQQQLTQPPPQQQQQPIQSGTSGWSPGGAGAQAAPGYQRGFGGSGFGQRGGGAVGGRGRGQWGR